MTARHPFKGCRGFSLTELLVAIAIVALLAALWMPVTGRIREASNSSRCIGNLRQIGGATAAYLADNNGCLPIALGTDMTTGSGSWYGAGGGAWYWNLAPYLGVPRWESVRWYLGQQGQKMPGPCVLTCPSHAANEPGPIVYPSLMPVSYAPSTRMVSQDPTGQYGNMILRQLRITSIKTPASKIWISDSTQPSVFNISGYRWGNDDPATDWARIAFSRHHLGGNALFFDGHVENIPLKAITEGNLGANLERWFTPVPLQ